MANTNRLYQRKMWNPRTTTNRRNARRRINKRNRNNPKDVGGYKQVYANGQLQTQVIELYNRIVMDNNNDAAYKFGNDSDSYSIQTALNNSDEFNELRRNCIQYKIMFVSVSFNYNRIPNNGEKFSKMLITPETDMVLETEDPKLNRNTMIWDMTGLGNKNYNFRITNRNTEKDNQQWLIGESQWNAVCVLHISQQGENSFNFDQDMINQVTNVLGEVKVSVAVRYLKNDLRVGQNKSSITRITNQQVLNAMRLKLANELGITQPHYDKIGNSIKGEKEINEKENN